jgi:hypothetical protein
MVGDLIGRPIALRVLRRGSELEVEVVPGELTT